MGSYWSLGPRVPSIMIAFASLFLGLVVGLEPVELLVGGEVGAVEIRLDGRPAGYLRAAPWSVPVDFGEELEPHELVAVAFDRDGRETGRARQWVNVPRRPAEASVVLEGGEEGRGVTARLSWESVVAARPDSIDVTFDGRTLAVGDPGRIALPAHDPEKLHFFRAELDFSRNVTSVLEIVFGGSYADELQVELTAVPLVLAPGARLPPVEELQRRLSEDGRALKVVAAEEGPAEIVVVRDEGVRRALTSLGHSSEKALRRSARVGLTSTGARSARSKLPLPRDHQVRFLWPFPERREQARLDFDVLTPSQAFTSRDGGLYWLLTETSLPVGTAGADQRLADAVAVAGLLAAGRNRRRAVVLVAGGDAVDASRFSPEKVRRYLRQLEVPLVVWAPAAAAPLARRWGEVADVSSLRQLEQAFKDLKRCLERQRIVWVEGVHLPGDVVLSPGAGGLSKVR